MTEPRDDNTTPDPAEDSGQPETTAPDPAPSEPEPAEPAPAEPAPAAAAGPTEPTGPAAPRAREQVAAFMGSRWLPPLATGLVGLALGLMIGAVSMGLIAGAVLHHGPRGHHGPGDGRGHHWQDERPPPPRR